MKKLATPVRLACCILSVMLLNACNITVTPTSAPEIKTIDDLPMYPGSTQVKVEESSMNRGLREGDEQTRKFITLTKELLDHNQKMGFKNEFREFYLPSGVTCNEVVTFYVERISSSGWAETQSPDLKQREYNEAFNKVEGHRSVRYSKVKETISLSCMPDKTIGKNYLFVAKMGEPDVRLQGIKDIPLFPGAINANDVSSDVSAIANEFVAKTVKSGQEAAGYLVASKPSCTEVKDFYKKALQAAGWQEFAFGDFQKEANATEWSGTFMLGVGRQATQITCMAISENTIIIVAVLTTKGN